MDPSYAVDDSFRNLFDKSAEIIHEEREVDRAHEFLDENLNHIDSGRSRTVFQVPSSAAEHDLPLVVKFALPEVGNTGTEDALYPVEYTEGWMANWHEIILSYYDALDEILLPIVDHDEDGLWLVMPYAETPERTSGFHEDLTRLAEQVESAAVEFVSYGETTGRPEIYQISAWGIYEGAYRLRDYGGIVVDDPEFRSQLPHPLSDPIL